MHRPTRPLLVFDGDCGFCRRWISRWRATTGDRVEYAPYQDAAERYPEIPRERFAEAVHLFEPLEERWSRGAEAVFRSLAYAPGHEWGLRFYRRLPGFAPLSERAYRLVSRHRPLFARLTDWIWGGHVVSPGERLTVWIFLRALALVYGVALVSLGTQILGLVGSQGILPAEDFLRSLDRSYGPSRYWLAPTFLWFGSGNAALIALCAFGALLAVLLAIGVAPVLCLAGLWATYLSLATVCRDFLWFQWDGLLLEAGFLAIFLAPWRWWSRPASDPSPPRLVIWLLRWLLFRMMFTSAVVKLASGDPTWRHLTALQFHYETQPLPPWTAWYVHHLPAEFHRASAVGTFLVEGLVPFLVFAPRRIRFAAGGAMAGFQVLILATGNYGFFNWLTLVLLLILLDDGVWARARGEEGPHRRAAGWPAWILRPVAGLLFLITLVPIMRSLGRPVSWLGPLPALYRVAEPLRTVNSYGLFAVMTTRRPEIVLEEARTAKNG